MSDWLSRLERQKETEDARKRQREMTQRVKREQEYQQALSRFLPFENDFAALYDSLGKYVARAYAAGIPVQLRRNFERDNLIYYLTLQSSSVNAIIDMNLDREFCLVTFKFSYIDVHDGSRKKLKKAQTQEIRLANISESHFEHWVRWAHENRKEKIKWSRFLPAW